jgi:hypothetical protein
VHLFDIYKKANALGIDCRFRSVVFSKKEYEKLSKELKSYKVRWQRGMITDFTWTRTKPCPAREKVFVVYWDGTLVPCCRMINGPDESICLHCREIGDNIPIKNKLI